VSRTTLVTPRSPDVWPTGIDVLAVDLDVREGSIEDAYAAIASVTRQLARNCRVFVKIDSTLRGPINGMVAGALDGTQRRVACVAPAFPEQGRHLRNGRLHLNGHEGPSLLALLGADRSVVARNDVETAVRSGARHVIVDAEDSQPLRQLAQVSEAHSDWLLVGSAGLARQLAPPHQPIRIPVSTKGPVLVIAGSPTTITRHQLTLVDGLPGVVVLATSPTETRDAGQAAAALADRVAAWADGFAPRAVVLTGGATARAVVHRLGASSLRIFGELEPGVPIGTFEAGAWHGVTVVTKAGGFGTPSTLLDVVRTLGVSSS
jgi:uncharacterized protein YgbK (DUF1537 family)